MVFTSLQESIVCLVIPLFFLSEQSSFSDDEPPRSVSSTPFSICFKFWSQSPKSLIAVVTDTEFLLTIRPKIPLK